MFRVKLKNGERAEDEEKNCINFQFRMSIRCCKSSEFFFQFIFAQVGENRSLKCFWIPTFPCSMLFYAFPFRTILKMEKSTGTTTEIEKLWKIYFFSLSFTKFSQNENWQNQFNFTWNYTNTAKDYTILFSSINKINILIENVFLTCMNGTLYFPQKSMNFTFSTRLSK